MSLNLGSVRLDLVANTSRFVRGMTMAQQSLKKTGVAAKNQEKIIKDLAAAEDKAARQYQEISARRRTFTNDEKARLKALSAVEKEASKDRVEAQKRITAAQQRGQRAAKKYADVQKGLVLFNIKAGKRANKELKASVKALGKEEKRLIQIEKKLGRARSSSAKKGDALSASLNKNSRAMFQNRKKIEQTKNALKAASMATKRFKIGLGALAGAAIGAMSAFYVMHRAVSIAFRATKAASDVARELEVELKRVGAVSNATTGELAKLKKQSLDLAVTFSQSATKLAEGMGFLGMAGFSATEILQAMPSVTKLATIGMMDFGAAADIASNIMTQWLIPAAEVGKVVDLMAATITTSNTNIRQMGDAMKYVAPVANSAGIDIQEVAAAIGLLGNAGIQGEMAGTALRNAITRLLNPSKKSAKIIKELGIEVKDSTGNMMPLVSILGDLQAAGMTTGEALQVFGQRAGPGMISLLQQGSAELARYRYQLELMEGVSDTLTNEILNSFDARVKKLKASFARLAEVVGGEVNVFLSGYVDILAEAFGAQENMTFAVDGTRGALKDIAPHLKDLVDTVHTLSYPLMVATAGLKGLTLGFERGLLRAAKVIAFFAKMITVFTDLAGVTDRLTERIVKRLDKMARKVEEDYQSAKDSVLGLPDAFNRADQAQRIFNEGIDAGTEKWRRQLVERAKIEESNLRIAHFTGNISSINPHLDEETARLWGLMSIAVDESSGALNELNKQFEAGAMHFDNMGGAFSMLSSQFGSSQRAFDTIQMAIDGLGEGADRTSSDVNSLIGALKKLQSYKAALDHTGSGRTGKPKKPPGGPKKPIDLSIEDAAIKLQKEKIKRLKLEGKRKGIINAENEKLIAAEKELISLAAEMASMKAAHKYGENSKQAHDELVLAQAKLDTLKAQRRLGLWESVMATPSPIPGIEEGSAARQKAREEAQELAEKSSEYVLESVKKRLELEKELLAVQKASILASLGGLGDAFDSSIINDQAAFLGELTQRRKALNDEETRSAELAKMHNESLEEQVGLYDGIVTALSETAKGYIEVSDSIQKMADATTEAAEAQAGLEGAAAAASAAVSVFDLLAEQLGESPAEKQQIKGAGGVATGVGELIAGLALGNPAMAIKGATTAFKGGVDYYEGGLAKDVKDETQITSPAGTKKREREKEDTTAAIVEALKEAGLYRPDVREQTLQFFGSDVLSLQQGRNSEARRQRVLQEVNLRDRF